MLTTDQKGAFAEAMVTARALALGIGVSRPLGDERYDLLLDLRPRLLRVQCKWTSCYGDVIIARCYRARRNSDGLVRRFYTADEVDAFALYCAEIDRAFLVPIEEACDSGTMQFRLAPTRNNQQSRIRWADDYDFAATLRRLGAVAQLGERRAGSAKATGSSPVGST